MKPNINRQMSANEWGLLLLLAFVWGSSFVYIEVLVKYFHPFSIVFGRTFLAGLVLWTFAIFKGLPFPKDWSTWVKFFVMGAVNNLIPFSLIAWGQIHIEGGISSILVATTPLFSVVLASVFTDDEKLTPGRLVGLLIGFFGVAVLIGFGNLIDITHDFSLSNSTILAAQAATLAGAGFYAVAAIFGKKYLSATSPVISAAGMLTGTAVLSLPLVYLYDNLQINQIEMLPGILLIGLALINTAAAYLIYFRILNSAGATNIMLVTFLNPVSALILGMLILGEQPSLQSLGGMVLIFLGLGIIDGRLTRIFFRD